MSLINYTAEQVAVALLPLKNNKLSVLINKITSIISVEIQCFSMQDFDFAQM